MLKAIFHDEYGKKSLKINALGGASLLAPRASVLMILAVFFLNSLAIGQNA